MLGLGQVGVGIAVIDQRVQKLRSLPNRLLALVEPEIFFLFAEDVVQRLVGMVEAVELGHAGICLSVVLAKLGFGLALLIAAFGELIQVIEIREWLCRNRCGPIHRFNPSPPWALPNITLQHGKLPFQAWVCEAGFLKQSAFTSLLNGAASGRGG